MAFAVEESKDKANWGMKQISPWIKLLWFTTRVKEEGNKKAVTCC